MSATKIEARLAQSGLRLSPAEIAKLAELVQVGDRDSAWIRAIPRSYLEEPMTVFRPVVAK